MLTQKGKYAIKALIYMAEKGVLVKTQDIADSAFIPKKFLEAILLELKRHGFVGSQQGATGGYFLIRPATEINLADLHRIFEGPIALIACAAEKFYKPCTDCENVATCTLRIAMKHVRDQTFDVLEDITIQKLVKSG
ncbi:MAG TPA: Rrf2 family transcriptional regulator [Saprospiraceae bacterium]|nr:Rrf2 family transcriptional regulator [Saprospiraceae bacterium]